MVGTKLIHDKEVALKQISKYEINRGAISQTQTCLIQNLVYLVLHSYQTKPKNIQPLWALIL